MNKQQKKMISKEGSNYSKNIKQGEKASTQSIFKRKSLNLAINNYFKQKMKNEEYQRSQVTLQDSSVKESAVSSFKEVEDLINDRQNTIITKLYEIISRIKIKKYALQLLNSTPSRKFKKLQEHQFSLINDKSSNSSYYLNDDQKQEIYSFRLFFFLDLLIFTLKNSIRFIPVFNPSNKYKILWDINFAFIISYSFFIIPIMICFGNSRQVPDQNVLTILFVEIIIDSVVTCNTGFYKRGTFCNERIKIWKKYQKEQLWIDSFSLLSIMINSYLVCASNLYKQYPFILIFSLLKSGKLNHLYNDLESKYIQRAQIRNILSLFRLLVKVLLIAHTFACVWVFVGRVSINVYTEKSWIVAQNLFDSSWQEQYLVAIYFCIVTMTTVGYGDVGPITTIEIIISAAIMLLSAGIFGFVVNTISDILQDFSKQKRIIMEKMFIIKKYLMKNSISPTLSNDITEYLEYQWRQDLEFNTNEGEAMVSLLSEELRSSLLIESNKIILLDCQLFQNNFSEQLKKAIVSIIQIKHYTPKQVIYSKGQSSYNSSMYFVQTGAVESFRETFNPSDKLKNKQETTIKKFKEGEYFGELEFFTEEDQNESIRSVKFTKLLKIERTDFINILKKYPEDYEQFCYIKDRLKTKQDYQNISQVCFSCKSQNHPLNRCPYLNFVPNKPKLIVMCNRDEKPVQKIGEDQFTSRTIKKQNDYNLGQLKNITEDFQILYEEIIEEYDKEYLQSILSQCDVCQTQQKSGNMISNTFSQKSNGVQFDNYPSSKNTDHRLQENQGVVQKMNLLKKIQIKNVQKYAQITQDDFEALDSFSFIRSNKSNIRNPKVNSEIVEIKRHNNKHQLTILTENPPIITKSQSILLGPENFQSEKHVQQSNLQESQLSTQRLDKVDYVSKSNYFELEKQNQNHLRKEQFQETHCFNNQVVSSPPQYHQKLTYQTNHPQIIFFELFAGQFEKKHVYQLYYPQGNYTIVIQKLSLDKTQKKKLKSNPTNNNNIVTVQRQFQTMKSQIQSKISLNPRMYQQTFEKTENYKGMAQNRKANSDQNNSGIQSSLNYQQEAMRNSVIQVPENQSNRSRNQKEEEDSHLTISNLFSNCIKKDSFHNRSESQPFNQYQFEEADDADQSFQRKNAGNERSFFNMNSHKYQESQNFHTKVYEYNNYLSPKEELSPPLRENKIYNQNALEVKANNHNYFNPSSKENECQDI